MSIYSGTCIVTLNWDCNSCHSTFWAKNSRKTFMVAAGKLFDTEWNTGCAGVLVTLLKWNCRLQRLLLSILLILNPKFVCNIAIFLEIIIMFMYLL